MGIDERIEALVMTAELLTHDVETLRVTLQEQAKEQSKALQEQAKLWDGRFDKLLTIAESHDRRLARLEDTQ